MDATLLFGMALLALAPTGATPAYANGSPASDNYVVARHGHFYIGRERVRFWGVNLQSGAFTSYAAIRHLSVRLSMLGLNAVRVWPTAGTFYSVESVAARQLVDATPGDGSDMDRFDFLLAQLFQRGMFAHMTALHYIDLPTIRRWPDPEVRAALGHNPSDALVRKLHGIAPYLLDGWEQMLVSHIRNVLSHRNPYTGRLYAQEPGIAAWELANESQFIHCLVNPECTASLPASVARRLHLLWDEFQEKEGHDRPGRLPVHDPDWDQSSTNRLHESYRRFLYSRFVAVSQRLERVAREMSPASGGVRVQPICYSTQAGPPLLLARAAYSAGDYVALGAYQTTMTEDKGATYYPYSLHLGDRSFFFNFNYGSVVGKPTAVYEISFFRPYPYRAEWSWALLNLAQQQNWDSAFLYIYGQPKVIYEERDGVPFYGSRPLPEPGGASPTSVQDITFGLHHGGDEIAMGSWVAAGRVFVGKQPSGGMTRTAIFPFDRRQVFGPAPGYCAGGPCTGATGVITMEMNRLSLSGPVRLDISTTERSSGNGFARRREQPPVDSPGTYLPKREPEAPRIVVDTPYSAAVAGKLRGSIVFSSGVEISFPDTAFGYVAVQSTDQRPIGNSNSLVVYAGGTSTNSGFAIDPERAAKGGTTGAMRGVISPGAMPLVMNRPAFEVGLPNGWWRIDRRDFNLRNYQASGTPARQFSATASEPFFRADLMRAH